MIRLKWWFNQKWFGWNWEIIVWKKEKNNLKKILALFFSNMSTRKQDIKRGNETPRTEISDDPVYDASTNYEHHPRIKIIKEKLGGCAFYFSV